MKKLLCLILVTTINLSCLGSQPPAPQHFIPPPPRTAEQMTAFQNALSSGQIAAGSGLDTSDVRINGQLVKETYVISPTGQRTLLGQAVSGAPTYAAESGSTIGATTLSQLQTTPINWAQGISIPQGNVIPTGEAPQLRIQLGQTAPATARSTLPGLTFAT